MFSQSSHTSPSTEQPAANIVEQKCHRDLRDRKHVVLCYEVHEVGPVRTHRVTWAAFGVGTCFIQNQMLGETGMAPHTGQAPLQLPHTWALVRTSGTRLLGRRARQRENVP